MRSVRDIPRVETVPVLVRAALNVPIGTGRVVDDYRLRRALPTIRLLAACGARVVLISHLGESGDGSLAAVAAALGKLVPHVSFCPETIGAGARAAIRALAPGHVLVLENLRRYRGEAANDPEFAKELAGLADVFVQDSFDTCHRAHASIVGVPKLLPSYAGLLLEEEVRELAHARTPTAPALAAVAGVKFNTKEPVLRALIVAYDHMFIGGALANDFLKAAGREVGKSLVSLADADAGLAELLANKRLILPIDVAVVPAERAAQEDARRYTRIAELDDVRSDEVILDHGPGTIALLADLAANARTVLWNGPFGNYENGFSGATDAFARAVVGSKARSVVGGGDTIAAIDELGLLPRFSFVSTGGGAMLEFLAAGTLPGIESLDSHASA